MRRKYDAVLILSCNPKEEMLARINAALPIYFKHAYDLSLSGVGSSEMRNLILRNNSLESQISLEETSRDTVGNAVFSKLLLALPKRWKSIAVVSSDFHIQRVKEPFSRAYGPKFRIEYFGAKSSGKADFSQHEKSSLERFKTDFSGIKIGDDAKMLQRLFEIHPLYKDDVDLKRRFKI